MDDGSACLPRGRSGSWRRRDSGPIDTEEGVRRQSMAISTAAGSCPELSGSGGYGYLPAHARGQIT
eukprot:4774564-Pyramimonas_sp.AAC.1